MMFIEKSVLIGDLNIANSGAFFLREFI